MSRSAPAAASPGAGHADHGRCADLDRSRVPLGITVGSRVVEARRCADRAVGRGWGRRRKRVAGWCRGGWAALTSYLTSSEPRGRSGFLLAHRTPANRGWIVAPLSRACGSCGTRLARDCAREYRIQPDSSRGLARRSGSRPSACTRSRRVQRLTGTSVPTCRPLSHLPLPFLSHPRHATRSPPHGSPTPSAPGWPSRFQRAGAPSPPPAGSCPAASPCPRLPRAARSRTSPESCA